MTYELGQKLEVFGVPDVGDAASFNGDIVVVEAMYGQIDGSNQLYAVRYPDGVVRPTHARFLRPFPPKLPNGRGDIDKMSNWEQFEKATGVSSDMIRGLNPNPDY